MTAVDEGAELGLMALLREDWETHGRAVSMPGLQALLLYRVGAWGTTRQGLPRVLAAVLHRLLNTFVIRNVYGIEISKTTVIGRRLLIAHHQGVILGYDAVIGDDCLVRQNVTIGAATDDGGQPRIGSGVHFGAGATVVGSVRVGDGARIAPGAVVTRHVPAGAIAFGPPVRLFMSARPDDGPVA